MMESFSDRLIDDIDNSKSNVCLGIDPRIKEIVLKYVPDNPREHYWIPESLVHAQVKKNGKRKGRAMAAEIFSKGLVDATDPYISVYKPNLAYFSALGLEGLNALRNLVEYIHETTGKNVILDSKSNDIGTTMLHYAVAWFDEFKVDATTINPYFGLDGVSPYMEHFINSAKKRGRGAMILCKTSNPSSIDFQDLIVGQKRVYELVAEKIAIWGKRLVGRRGYSSLGAVVGATFVKELKLLRTLLSRNLLLIPGLQVQGGNPEDVAAISTDEDGYGAIFSSSRGINFAYMRKEGYTDDTWKEAASDSARELKNSINQALTNRRD